MYALLSKQSIKKIVEFYEGKLYSDLKKDLSSLIIEELTPIQEQYNILINDKDYLLTILKEGSDFATYTARKTLSKVYRKIGLVQSGI